MLSILAGLSSPNAIAAGNEPAAQPTDGGQARPRVGLVLAGGGAKGLEEFVTGIDWRAVVGGVGKRDLQTIEQKRAGVTYSNDIEMEPKDRRVQLPAGIVRFVYRSRPLTLDGIFATMVANMIVAPAFAQVYLLIVDWDPLSFVLPVPATERPPINCCTSTCSTTA